MTGKMVAAAVTQDDTDVLLRYTTMLSESCPRMVIVGIERFGRQARTMVCLLSMPNVFTGSCARMRCCLSENRCTGHRNGHILAKGRERKQSTMNCSGRFRSSAVITDENWGSLFALDCCDREAPTGRSPGGFDGETVQDVMLGRWNAAEAASFRHLQWVADG